MPFQVSPGVNVSEIDLTTVVPAVSTTEGGFAGQFQWGPADQRILVDSEDRLVNIFQKPNNNNADDFFTAANFLSYGNALYVVRVVKDDARNAATGTAQLIKNDEVTVTGTSTFLAKYPGALGNSLKVSVCPDATAWREVTSLAYNVTRNSDQVVITGANSDSHADALSVGDMLELGSNAQLSKIVSVAARDTNNNTITITVSDKFNGATASHTSLARNWEFSGSFDAAPGTTAYATALGGSNDEIHVAVVDEDGLITGTKGTVLETYEGVSLANDAKTETGAANYFKELINQGSSYIIANAAIYSSGTASTSTFSTDGNVNDNSLTGGLDGTNLDSDDKIVGYDLFSSAEDVDVSFLLGGNANSVLAIHLITNIAESRKDCIAVISPESSDVVGTQSSASKRDAVISFRDAVGASSSYAVMDSGWKYQYDKYNDVYRYVPLNADTAGLMVQTDLTRDPWFSPAGYNRGNVKNAIKLAYNPSKGDRDQLYKKNINPVVTFPGQGTVLFGDKTLLAKPSAFDRINVRRLFIVLEKAISTAAKFTLFEFNDEFTRSQFTNLVVPFLRDVQGRRGITDFQVVCDGTNNTGEVIDRNEFIGDIYIKPARSINFIQLNFVAVRSGVEFSEVVGRA